MSKLSVILPSRNEIFLSKTIDDLFAKASGSIDVIAVIDENWPDPPLKDRPGLHILKWGNPKGMRAGINAGAAIAKGDWLMKADAHCMFAEGFDEVLKSDCDQDWMVIPRRFSLDAENWCIEKNGKPPRDYHYLSNCVWSIRERDDYSMHGLEWPERGGQRSDPIYDIDDNMSCQGSCWFCSAEHFRKRLGGLNEFGYGTFSQEFQEIGNKTWLMGGSVKVNKKTFYCHLHKGRRYGRMYHQSKTEVLTGHAYSAWFWMTDQPFNGKVHDMKWLVEKFWPIPTWYPDMLENWDWYFPQDATLDLLKQRALTTRV